MAFRPRSVKKRANLKYMDEWNVYALLVQFLETDKTKFMLIFYPTPKWADSQCR